MKFHLIMEPNTLIGRHFQSMLSLSLLLESLGIPVKRVSCLGILSSNCLTMQYLKIPPDKSRDADNITCLRCRGKNTLDSALLGSSTVAMDALIGEIDVEFVNREIRKLEENINTPINFNGIAIHKNARYETILRFKELDKSNTWNPKAKEFFIETCRSSFYWSIFLDKLIRQGAVHSISLYNPLYSMNSCSIQIAKSLNVPCLAVHAHDDAKDPYKRLYFSSGNAHFLEILGSWKRENLGFKVSNRKLNRYSERHLRAVRSSKLPWQYSVPSSGDPKRSDFDVKAKLTGFTTLAFIPLSSSDEVNALRATGFGNTTLNSRSPTSQIEMLRWVLNLSQQHPEVLFWIRLHPRMFQNKRDSLASEEGTQLQTFLELNSRQSKNVFIDSGKSYSYFDILKESDLVINFLSTIAVDAGLLDIPVLSPYFEFNFPNYPIDIVFPFYGYEDLLEKFQQVLSKPKGKRQIAMRWLYFSKIHSSFRIPTLSNSLTILFFRIINYKLSSSISKNIFLKSGVLLKLLEIKVIRYGKLYSRTNKKIIKTLNLELKV